MNHNRDKIVDSENNITDRVVIEEHISTLINQLEHNCSKLEQSAFDSINTTDQVMMGLRDAMETFHKMSQTHQRLREAFQIASVTLNDKEARDLNKIVKEQAQEIILLEVMLDKVVNASMDAADAAHCIENEVAEQSGGISDFIQYNEMLSKQKVK